MTVEAMSSLPLQAGGAVAAAAGRTALWAISAYMRQPLRNTALLALVGFSALAGANALYKQAHHHPAPLFGSFDTAAPVLPRKVAPVMPAARPHVLDEPVSDETTGSVETPARVLPSFGKEDVAALQTKLASLGFFTGSVDGIFGPRTSKALKAFETSVGRPAAGQLNGEAVALVRDAPLPGAASSAAAPVAVAKTDLPPLLPRTTAPAAGALPAPAPLLPSAEPAASDARTAIEVAAAEPQQATPALALAETNTNTNTTTVPKRTVQTIAVRATQPTPAPAAQPSQPEASASADPVDPSVDRATVAAVQRGLNSLGFLHAPVDGTAGEATAKAIRNFEVYFNYNVTGRVTKQLVELLEQNGAVI